MAVGTLVFEKSSYENVLCLGHILAEDGRKMSKHLGNILEPIPLMDRHGADAVRWFMLAGGSPWSARRVGHETLSEVVRKVLLTYWNTASFFTLYAEANGWDPAATPGAGAGRAPAAGPLGAGRAGRGHRGRHRGAGGLRHPDGRPADRAASSTTCPTGTCAGRGAASGTATPAALAHAARGARRADPADGAVHARSSPRRCGPRAVAPGLRGATRPTRCTWPRGRRSTRTPATTRWSSRWRWSAGWSSSAGRPARRRRCAPASRWPVRSSPRPAGRTLPRDLVAEVADELNVLELVELAGAVGGELVDVTVKIDFRAVGRRMGKQVQAVAQAVAAADAGRAGRRLPRRARRRSRSTARRCRSRTAT